MKSVPSWRSAQAAPQASVPDGRADALNPDTLARASVARLRREYETAEPFPHVVLEGLFSETLLEAVLADFDAVHFADWLRFDNARELKSATRPNAALGEASQRYFDILHRGAFLRFLSDITGIDNLIPDPTLFGGGLHDIPSGGKFAVHTDFNKHPATGLDTRLVLITYLNHDWQPDYGGALELFDAATDRPAKAVVPVFGRSILFGHNSRSLHGHPRPIAAPGGRTRRSVAAYFYTNGRPDEDATEFRTTKFHQPMSAGQMGRLSNIAKYLLPPIVVDGVRRIRGGG